MQSITRDELKHMNEQAHEDFVLVNVLPREAFREAHIRTSVNVPLDDDHFVERMDAIAGGRDRRIVVYCASFDCDASEKAAGTLEDAGFTDVLDYEGGTRDWFEQREAA